jgi:hypothetical protein
MYAINSIHILPGKQLKTGINFKSGRRLAAVVMLPSKSSIFTQNKEEAA